MSVPVAVPPSSSSPCASSPASPCLDGLREELIAANINPRTGLATDYLNHFNEMVMLLQIFPSLPEVADEIRAWMPLSYREHFEKSGLRGTQLALTAYDLTPPGLRRRFEALLAELSTMLLEAQRVALAAPDPAQTAAPLAEAIGEAERLIGQAGGLVNDSALEDTVSVETTQAAVDALFDS